MTPLAWWKGLDRPSRILLLVALGIAIILAGGTLFAGIRLIVTPAAGGNPAARAPLAAETNGGTADIPAVVELGRIRATSAPPEPVDIVIALSFPHDESDIPFGEELFANKHLFHEDVRAFFAEKSARTVRSMRDDTIRNALLERFNRRLLLGKIQELWLHEYLVIE